MLKPDTHDEIGAIIAYVMRVLMTGMFPDVQWDGAPWPEKSLEFKRAGQPFAGGWRACFAAFKADLEARAMVHKMVRNWSCNSICEHCLASKLPELSYGDFSDGASYMQFMLTHDEFLELNPPHRQSSWINVPGWTKDRNLDDMLHVVHQGIGPLLIASLLSDHYEELHEHKLTLKQLEELLQNDAWPHYKQWVRARKLPGCSMQFSLTRIGRENWKKQPEMASCYKAAVIKAMLYWIASFLLERKQENQAGFVLRADLSYNMAQFHYVQDCNGPWLDDQATIEMAWHGHKFLLLYQYAAEQAKSNGRVLYKLVPKFHVMLHMCLRLPLERRNPRYDHLYMEEDFMKEIGRIASRTHARTMASVTLLRYRALLESGGLGPHEQARNPHRYL
eukprot:s7437_g4.t1